MPTMTLCVDRYNQTTREEMVQCRGAARTCVPTQSVGTSFTPYND